MVNNSDTSYNSTQSNFRVKCMNTLLDPDSSLEKLKDLLSRVPFHMKQEGEESLSTKGSL